MTSKLFLSFEVTSTSFILTKNGYLCPATNENDLQKNTRTSQFPFKELKANHNFGVFFDFMAYDRKWSNRVNKAGIKTFGDFVENIWQPFLI